MIRDSKSTSMSLSSVTQPAPVLEKDVSIPDPISPPPSPNTCPTCGEVSKLWDRERAEIVCSHCGTVLEDRMIDYENPESRYYNREQEQKRARTAPLNSLPRSYASLATTTRDGTGKALAGPGFSRANRIFRTQVSYSSTTEEKNWCRGVRILGTIESTLQLPLIVHTAAIELLRRVVKANKTFRLNLSIIVASCLYHACKQAKIRYGFVEIAKAMEPTSDPKATANSIYRGYSKLYWNHLLTGPRGHPDPPTEEERRRVSPSHVANQAVQFIPRYCSLLNLPNQVENRAMVLVKDLQIQRSPHSLAAASIYIATNIEGEYRTQRQISKICNVTTTTIREVTKLIQNAANTRQQY